MASASFPDACLTLSAKLGSDDDIYGSLSSLLPSVHFNIQMSNLTKQFTMSQFKLQFSICQFRGLDFATQDVY